MWRTKPHISRPLQHTSRSSDSSVQFAGLKWWKEITSNSLKFSNSIKDLTYPNRICVDSLAEISKKMLLKLRVGFRTFHTIEMPHPFPRKIAVMVHRDPATLLTQIALYHQLSPPAFLQLLERQFWVVHGINIHQVGRIRIVHCHVSLLLTVCPVREQGRISEDILL